MSHTTQPSIAARRSVDYEPPSPDARAALTTECLLAILAGRPFPEAARPIAQPVTRPMSVRENIARILRGPGA